MEPIKGFENYMIDRDGNILGTKRNRYLKHILNGGYFSVSLTKDRKTYIKKIHRLIALQFIPNRDNLPIVDHIDRDTQNNSLENLRWATHKLNSNNQSVRKDSKSKRKWIIWNTQKQKWQIEIKKVYIGVAKTIEEAVVLRNEYCEKNNIEIIE